VMARAETPKPVAAPQAVAVAKPMAAPQPVASPKPVAAPQPVAALKPVAVAKPAPRKAAKVAAKPKAKVVDDISMIGGIGPKITKMLAKEGVTSLGDIAKMSASAIAALDEKLELRGRSAREEWIDQAKELLAGKAPRAKSDRARKAAKK
jgi:large subunit ribosomal protein L21